MRERTLTFSFAALSVAFAACSSDRPRPEVVWDPDASIGSGGANAGGSPAGGTSSSGGATTTPANGGRSTSSNGGSPGGGTTAASTGGRSTSSSAGGTANAAGSATDSGVSSDADAPRRICDPGLVVSPTCAACEVTKCVGDAAVLPSCDHYATAKVRAACTAVLDCVRRTNCLNGRQYGCYCGSLDYESCQMTDRFTPDGACAKEIVAGLPANVDPIQVSINTNHGDVRYPSGGALALAHCESLACWGDCTPYCRHPGEIGAGGWGGSGGYSASGGSDSFGGTGGIHP
jgi:hypothetical protein